MEIRIRCEVEQSHIDTIRKFAKLVEKSATKEVYQLFNVTAEIEGTEALIVMKLKKDKDRAKAEKKLFALLDRFGLKYFAENCHTSYDENHA